MYKVYYALENVSDKPVYNFEFSLLYSERFKIVYYNDGSSVYEAGAFSNYTFGDRFSHSYQAFMPGDQIEFYALIPFAYGEEDEYSLRESIQCIMGGSTAEIPYTIDSKYYEIFDASPIAISDTASFDHSLEYTLYQTQSTKYNPELAASLVQLARCAYDRDQIGTCLTALGFTEQQNIGVHYDVAWSDNIIDTPAYSIGKKTLTDGTELILIVTLGSRKIHADWFSNVKLSVAGEHSGFSLAATRLYQEISDCLAANGKEKTVVITGHSRGGAIGNLLAKRLREGGFSKFRVYDYNFACPDTVVMDSLSWQSYGLNGDYGNIFNLALYNDIVSMLPGAPASSTLLIWGKYGRSYWVDQNGELFNPAVTVSDGTDVHNRDNYVSVFAGKRPALNDMRTRDELVSESLVNSTTHWTGIAVKSSADIEITDSSGNPVASLSGEEADYHENDFGSVIIIADEEEKVVYVPYGSEYQVKLTGTESGTMDFRMVGMNLAGETFSAGTFSNVAMTEGKTVVCTISAEQKDKNANLYVETNGRKTAEILENGEEVSLTEIVASGECGDNLTWTLDDAGVLTISGTGTMWDYNFPAEYAPWYSQQSSIKSVAISTGVTGIGNYAFYDCSALTSITIPEGVTSIGKCAFCQCSSLISIAIPAGVTSIGEDAFVNCDNLTNIYADAENAYYKSVDGVLFNKAGTELIRCPGGKSGNYTIPEGVTSVSNAAFYNCSNLISINIPDGVTIIGECAFSYCTSLTSVTIPEGVTSIEEGAFCSCSSLTFITLPNSLTSIGETAFLGCSMTSITIPARVTSIGTHAFYNCSSLTSIRYLGTSSQWANVEKGTDAIPNGVSISYAIVASGTCGENVNWALDDEGLLTISGTGPMINYSSSGKAPWYSQKSSIKSVTIDSGVTTVGDYALAWCSNLKDVILPTGVTSIGIWSFVGCSNLTSITIPAGVTSIGDYAFYNCGSLVSISLPEGVTSIGGSAFSSCSSLTSITIPTGVRSIGNYAFSDCSSLTSITLPEGVTSIGENAFYLCSKLPSITIPEGVDSISKLSFAGCTSLTSITILEGVKSIGSFAFEGCSSLTDINVPEGATIIGESAFYNCSSLASITLPTSLTSIGATAFCGCNNLTIITLPSSVTNISGSVFNGCNSLTTISVNEENAYYSSMDGVLFNKGRTELIRCPESKSGSYTVPENVESIGDYAFNDCSSLTNIFLPESVESIGNYTFSWCSSLTSITIPSNMTSIGDYAFHNCDALTDVYYAGDESVWGSIAVGSNNDRLTSATKHFNTDSDPCADGHNWGAVSYTWSDDHATCTATRSCTNDASHSETANATVSSSVTTQPTATTEGRRTYIALFSESWAKNQVYIETLPALTVQDITVTLSGGKVTPGGVVIVKVALENNPGITGFAADVIYDHELLTLLSVESSIGKGSWSGLEEAAETDSVLWYSGESYEDNGEILTLTFAAAAAATTGETTVSLSFEDEFYGIADAEGTECRIEVNSCTVSIDAHKPGDTNGDGKVTIGDVALLARYVQYKGKGVTIVTGTGDTNGDGKVTIGDVALLARYVQYKGKGVTIH